VRRPGGRDGDFWWALGIIATAGLAVRAVIAARQGGLPAVSDPTYYHLQAGMLADGLGFSDPFQWAYHGELRPTAAHPPLFSALLAFTSKLGITSVFGHRLVGCVLGAGSVVAVGLLGRRVSSRSVGLVAAAIVALYPGFWSLNVGLFSESLLLLAAYRFLAQPRWREVWVAGVLTGLLVVTRSELLLLVPALLMPLLLRPAAGPLRRRLAYLAVAAGLAVLPVAPWVVRNASTFGRPVMSTNGDFILVTIYCPSTFAGERLGWYDQSCAPRSVLDGHGSDEADRSAEARDIALRYAADHPVPLATRVLAARLGRQWSLYRPVQTARWETDEGRPPGLELVTLLAFYLVAAAAVVGTARLRGVPRWPLLVPVVVVTVTAAVFSPNVRIRAVAEPGLVVLAAVGVVAGVEALRRRRVSEVPTA
jgi:4-amino-4-deoxy-L-arabinose transferase-like glycosyltransferase